MSHSDDLDMVKSELGEIKGKLDRVTSEGRKTSLYFTTLGVGLALLLAGIVLLAVGSDYSLVGDGSTIIVLSSDSILFGRIFTIIGLVVIVAGSALAALWPRVRRQD